VDSTEITRARDAFPVLRALSPEGFDLLARAGRLTAFTAGQELLRAGDHCDAIALVLAGEIRVHKTSETGRDLTLYRLFPGQTCVLTANCMLSKTAFPACATVTEDTSALLVSHQTFDHLFAAEERWRDFIFQATSQRLTDLLELIDEVLFTDLPARLADALLTQQQAGEVHLTHEQIAAEVGSSREAVSRILKGWEKRGMVTLARGKVAIRANGPLTDLRGQ
jgi:CRP/FNR family transcriptional regulator